MYKNMVLRDSLFTEKQYLDQLTKYSRRSRQLENSIDELLKAEKEHVQLYSVPNREVLRNKCNTLFGCQLNSFVTKYSMGEDVVKLRSDYDDLVKILKDNWTITGGYVQMLWMLSIGIMLDTDINNIQILSDMINDEHVDDFLYNIFIKYRLPNWERNSNTILFPIPYQSMLSIFISSKQSNLLAIEKIEKYIKKEWYRGHSDCSWYNDHKYGIVHNGYWSFESGALVKVLGLDDSILKGQPYYPYDMVNWADGQK